MKYGIRLRSKYTGESIVLGSQFDSLEKAKEWAKEGVCHRCNSVEIIYIQDDSMWMGKERGFVPIKYLEENKK